MKKLALAAVLTGFALSATGQDAPAAAEVCTEAVAARISDEIVTFIQQNPSEAQKIEGYMVAIEKDYGGEPSEAQTCEALGKLLAMVKGEG